MRRAMLALAITTILGACGPGAGPAAPSEAAAVTDWTLAPAESRVAFASVKADRVGEAHYFRELSGAVTADGAFTLEIPLASVETNIEIRNERMRDMLFEVAQFPSAKLSGSVDLATLSGLAVGERTSASIPAELELHGVKTALDVPVFITRISENRVAVETSQPVLIEAGAFGLDAGLERLRTVANLPSISPVAPVTASLVFER